MSLLLTLLVASSWRAQGFTLGLLNHSSPSSTSAATQSGQVAIANGIGKPYLSPVSYIYNTGQFGVHGSTGTTSSSSQTALSTRSSTTQSDACAGTGFLMDGNQGVYTYTLTQSVLTAFPTIYDVQYISGNQTYYSPTLLPRTELSTCLTCLEHVPNCGYGEYTQDPGITYATSFMLSSVQYISCFGKSITITSLASYPQSAFLNTEFCIRQATISVSYDYTKDQPSFETGNDIYLQSFDQCTTTITYVAALRTEGGCTATNVGAINPLLDPNKLQVRVALPAAVTLASVPATQTPEQQVVSPVAEPSSTPSPSPQSPEQQVIATPTPTPEPTPVPSPDQPAAQQSDSLGTAAQTPTPESITPQNDAVQNTDSAGTSGSQNNAAVGNTSDNPSQNAGQSQASDGSVSALSNNLASTAQAVGSAAQQALQDIGAGPATVLPANAASALSQLAQTNLPAASAVQALQALNADLASAAATASNNALSQILVAESSISSVLRQISAQATTMSVGVMPSVSTMLDGAGSTHLSSLVSTSTTPGTSAGQTTDMTGPGLSSLSRPTSGSLTTSTPSMSSSRTASEATRSRTLCFSSRICIFVGLVYILASIVA